MQKSQKRWDVKGHEALAGVRIKITLLTVAAALHVLHSVSLARDCGHMNDGMCVSGGIVEVCHNFSVGGILEVVIATEQDR